MSNNNIETELLIRGVHWNVFPIAQTLVCEHSLEHEIISFQKIGNKRKCLIHTYRGVEWCKCTFDTK